MEARCCVHLVPNLSGEPAACGPCPWCVPWCPVVSRGFSPLSCPVSLHHDTADRTLGTPNSGSRDRRWIAGLLSRPTRIFCAPGASVRIWVRISLTKVRVKDVCCIPSVAPATFFTNAVPLPARNAALAPRPQSVRARAHFVRAGDTTGCPAPLVCSQHDML
eukprot:gene24766-biopygen23919